LGTPWHHAARVKGAGVDCAWLSIEVYSAVGLIEPFDPGYYPQDFAQHRGDELYQRWVRDHAYQVDYPLPGDMALFKWGRSYSHGAIVIGWPRLIHAYARVGAVVLDDAYNLQLVDREPIFYRLNILRDFD
jgi:cell wall-associated NlpC family hydrolase